MKFLKFLFLFISLSIVKVTVAQINTPKSYNLNNGLPSLKINNITQDYSGYLWFTSDKGIFNFDGQNFTSLSLKDSLISNNTTSISVTKNTLFIGTNSGLSIRKRNKFLNYPEKEINCILTTPQHTFLGTNKGILRVREDFLSNIRTNFQIDLNTINDIKFDGNFYWIATNKALFKLDKLINPTIIKRIDLGNYTSIIINKKNIIATTYNKGISIVNNDKIRFISTSLKTITNIKFIDHQFWIISKTEGIEILNSNFNFIKTINKYNTLKTNQINDVFQDQQKNIWIATNNEGLYKIVSENINQKKTKITFQNIEVVYKSIDSVSINDYKKILQLKPSENHISFTYKTIDINNPKNVLYRYKLNDNFSKWTNKNTVDLPYLNSGKYTFTAQSKIGEVISNPIEFSFFIDMPLYQKRWFQQLSIAIIIFILIIITFFYVKKIKAKNKAKIDKLKLENHLLSLEQKALQLQMNPHFIFNVLNGIKALGNSENKTTLNTTISKFATLLRNVLHNSRQEEISLADEIFALKNYVELEQQMNSNLFEFDVITNLNINVDEILIPPMLIQPFIENSIEHGFKNKKDGKITITFTTKDQLLICSIIDNGIGFHQSKKQKKHDSLAVSITQERIKSLSKKSSFIINEIIKNNNISGTKVSFKIPLKTDF